MSDVVTVITDGACSGNGRDGSRGGWAAIVLAPGHDEVVLTGEHTDRFQGWMEGAVRSGRRAAAEVLARR